MTVPRSEVPKQTRDPGSSPEQGLLSRLCWSGFWGGEACAHRAVCTGCGSSLSWAPMIQMRTGLRLGLSWNGPNTETQRARTQGWWGPLILCDLGVNEGTRPPVTQQRSG